MQFADYTRTLRRTGRLPSQLLIEFKGETDIGRHIRATFGRAPEEAIDYLRNKGIAVSSEAPNPQLNHERTFTVARLAKADLLADLHQGILRAMTDGRTIDDFRKEFLPRLESEWGGQTGSRLDTIFRTNAQMAFQAGRYTRQMDIAELRPYLQYVSTLDRRTTTLCRNLNETVKPTVDPFWQAYYPPNHFNCRATAISVDGDELRKYGLQVSDPPPITAEQSREARRFNPHETYQPRLERYPRELQPIVADVLAGFDPTDNSTVEQVAERLVVGPESGDQAAPEPAPADQPTPAPAEPVQPVATSSTLPPVGYGKVERSVNAPEAEHHLFGRDLTDDEWLKLVGSPGANIVLEVVQGDTPEIHITLADDQPEAAKGLRTLERTIGRDRNTGELVITNDYIHLRKNAKGTGLGTAMLASQVNMARQLGIDTIRCHAQSGGSMNGYYTWPRLGYDGELPQMDLPPGLEHAKRLSDLMTTPEGIAWWREKGSSFDAEFDTRAGSYSSRVLDAVIQARDEAAAEPAPSSRKKSSSVPAPSSASRQSRKSPLGGTYQ